MISSAAASIVPRASWPRLTAARCCCRRQWHYWSASACLPASSCAIWAQCDCAIWRVPSACIRSCIRSCGRTFRRLRSLEATPNNLPQQVTSFVGRERELADIRNQLGNTRLLTLFGAGGLGKTRLSLQVAAEVLDDYPDGVWFVDLAPMADERLVPQAAASVLGVKEEAGRPVLEALVKYVSDRKLLLILDNCEHLLHACAELAIQLLQSGPDLKILASSREHLHVKGETTYPVPPLSVPDPQTRRSLSKR